MPPAQGESGAPHPHREGGGPAIARPAWWHLGRAGSRPGRTRELGRSLVSCCRAPRRTRLCCRPSPPVSARAAPAHAARACSRLAAPSQRPSRRDGRRQRGIGPGCRAGPPPRAARSRRDAGQPSRLQTLQRQPNLHAHVRSRRARRTPRGGTSAPAPAQLSSPRMSPRTAAKHVAGISTKGGAITQGSSPARFRPSLES